MKRDEVWVSHSGYVCAQICECSEYFSIVTFHPNRHFQDFYRAFRAKEKTSFHAAKVFAMECFKMLPVKVC